MVLLVVNADGKNWVMVLDRTAGTFERVELSPFDIHLDEGGFGFRYYVVNRNALHHYIAIGCQACAVASVGSKAQFVALGAYGCVERANPGGDGRFEGRDPLGETVEVLGVGLESDHLAKAA